MACAGALESFRTINQAGVPTIAEHILTLQNRFLEGLARIPAWAAEAERLKTLLDAGRLGSILALHHGDRGPEGMHDLLMKGIRRGVYASVREGYLRVAFHGWHEEKDVERVVDWLK
jgi:selenocysteine lyase/cysteine desulfurase